MTFAQNIVFIEEMYESAVNDNAEDFPKVAVYAYPTLVIGVKFVYTFVDWKMPEIRRMLKRFKYSHL